VHQAGKHLSRRQALGLPDPAVLRDPARLDRVRSLIASAQDSAVLAGLVHLAGDVGNADSAQLSLLADVQHATVIQCCEPTPWQQTSDVDDSLCTVTVLSRDVLVAADTHRHPWLHDLPPVLTGAVGAYLGVPLQLTDGTIVGALCVYGPRPRTWTERDVTLTCQVAEVLALELQRLSQPLERLTADT